MKSFEYEFHSADYRLMIEVVTGLRTIMGHLVKVLDEESKDLGNLKSEKALQFMQNLHKQDTNVLHEIGVQNASQLHLDCLANLPLTVTYSCLRLFFRWVEEGFYDYSTLPFPFKVHLSDQDRLTLEELPLKWDGTISELMNDLQKLIDALKHSERDITGLVNEAVNVGLIKLATIASYILLFYSILRCLFLTT